MSQMQSNCIRGEYMKKIIADTIKEIHDDMVTVFGPYATDAYIVKGDNPYYTRDGLETIHSMRFDNELAMYVLTMMYQAVYRQGKKVGDGTTSLAVLYTNLYNHLVTNRISRDRWNRYIKELNDRIRARVHTMTNEELKSLLYTCMQDAEFAGKLFNELEKPIMDGAYIVVSPSNNESDFTVTTHTQPLIKCTKLWQMRPFGETDAPENVMMLHCNGMLDISHTKILLQLIQRTPVNAQNQSIPVTYVILCNGITDKTRATCKELTRLINGMKKDGVDLSLYSNVAILALDNYRGMSAEEIEDLSTIITDENGLGSVVNPIIFEAMLWQCIQPEGDDPEMSDLSSFDSDMVALTKMTKLLSSIFEVQYDAEEGLRIMRPLGPVAQKRYDDLRAEIEDSTTSEVKRVGLRRRLKSMYGQFIELEIGSKLIKDSQRKYELAVDAILSSAEGVKYGVLSGNSLLIALQECLRWNNAEDEYHECQLALSGALADTIRDMFDNRMTGLLDEVQSSYANVGEKNTLAEMFRKCDVEKFDLTRENVREILPHIGDKINPRTIQVGDLTIDASIVEPVTVITTMLESSTVMLELAQAKTFHLKSFLQNYI